MGVAKFDDGIPDGPKFIAAGPVACWLWFAGVCYCRRTFTDGFIPKSKVPGLVVGLKSPYAHAALLVEVRLWDEAVGGYQVHDYLDWNPTKATVDEYRRRDKERKRQKFPDRIPDGLHQDSRSDSTTRGASHADAKKKSEEKKESEKESKDRFEAFWRNYPRKVGKSGAERAWKRLHVTPELWRTIAAALGLQAASAQWLKDGGEFVPYPATWLNGRRWEDEVSPAARPRSLGPAHRHEAWEDECLRLHECACAGPTEHAGKMAAKAAKAAKVAS